jgi:AsmA protein
MVGLLVVTAVVLTLTFDPNDYKPLIVKLVKEKKQRTLTIEGDIKLAFWPKLGANLGKVSLSDHNSDKVFASMESAKVFVAVMPLLKKQLVVDTVRVDAVQANIVRYKDGTTNFDDLLSEEEESEEIKFDIDGVKVGNSALTLVDEMGGRHIAISGLELQTGHVAKNEPIDLQAEFAVKADNPAMDAKVQFNGTLLADTEQKRYGAKGLVLAVQGDVATLKAADIKLSGDLEAKPEQTEFSVDGLKLALKANMGGQALSLDVDAPRLSALNGEVSGKQATVKLMRTQGEDMLSANLVVADLKGSPKAFQSSGINGEISGKQGARSLNGSFSSPFVGDLENMKFDLTKLAGSVSIKDPALPKGAATVAFNVKAHADLKQEEAKVGLDADIDGAKLRGDVAVTGFAKPNIKFDLTADRLDLNKLLGSNQAKPKHQTRAKVVAKPADLSALKDVLAEGKLNVGEINYDKYRISNLAMAVKADGKSLFINPLAAKIDDSQIRGSVAIRNFERALYVFDLDIDRVDADRYLTAETSGGEKDKGVAESKPLDLSALKALNAEGSLRIGSLKYGKVQSSNIRIDLKADGEKLRVDPFAAKVDDSQVKASVGITRFSNPQFSFDVNIDRLDVDRYVTKSEAKGSSPAPAAGADTPLDLSALRSLNASGEARLGWLKLANVKTSNVRLGLKADGGLVKLSPFSADLYQGTMAGALNLDARTTPVIAVKQDMKGINIGPLLADAINNDMLDGKGNLSLDVKTQGATVGALKKGLNGTAAVNLADGAIKGFDLAGTIRDAKSKLNVLKAQGALGADEKKKTDFSEMKASFNIRNGVARNEDLDIKSPLFRIVGSGDIDIGNEKLNYLAKPTVVATLKGQGGSDLGQLNGLTIPVKVSGTFSEPKYGPDFAAIGTALAQKQLLEKVGGDKAVPLQQLLGGDKAGALESLIGGKKTQQPAPAPMEGATPAPIAEPAPAPAEQPKKTQTPEEKAKEKLNKLLGL